MEFSGSLLNSQLDVIFLYLSSKACANDFLQAKLYSPDNIMKNPNDFYRDEEFPDPFVTAAKTYELSPACDLLFINGNDLTWGRSELGLFLASVEIGDSFEEIAEVAGARSELSFIQLMSRFFPRFTHSFAKTAADAASKLKGQPDDEQRRLLTADIASQYAEKEQSQFDNLIPVALGEWLHFAGGIASWLARGAIHLRLQQLANTGMSAEQYEDMLYALQYFGLCESIVRIAYPAHGSHSELSLTSGVEFRVTEIHDDAHFIEIFRLNPKLASLKRNQDKALAVFIANYINQHHIGPRKAFACARYGEQSEHEYDVIIPSLKIGFEVKLYQAPFANVENKLRNLANKLDGQLKSYQDIGCREIYYVSNLSKGDAESVLSKVSCALKIIPIAGGVTSGLEELLPVLTNIGKALDDLRDKNLELEVHGRIAKSKQKKGRS